MTKSTARIARQKRRRERVREEKRVAAIAEAERLELLNELISPAAQRKVVETAAVRAPGQWVLTDEYGPTWVDGDVIEKPRLLRGSRVAIVADKLGRRLPMPALDPALLRSLTEDHLRAARRIQADWDEVGAGLGVSAVDYLRAGGATGDGPRGHGAMLAQIATRVSLEAALTHLGAFTPIVARVVLDRVPLSTWAEETGRAYKDALAFMVQALDRLMGFYWPAPEVRHARIRTIGPRREEYGTDVEDETTP